MQLDKIEGLIEALSSADQTKRWSARYALAAEQTAVLQLVPELLASAEPDDIVGDYIPFLASLKSKEALDCLAPLLDHTDKNVCISAAIELGKAQDSRATSILITALPATDPSTRAEIVDGLATLASPRAVDAIETAFFAATDPATQIATAKGVVKAMSLGGVPRYLTEIYHHGGPDTRCLLLEAPSVQRDERVLGLLPSALQDIDVQVRMVALTAVHSISRSQDLPLPYQQFLLQITPVLEKTAIRDPGEHHRVEAGYALANIRGAPVFDSIDRMLQQNSKDTRLRGLDLLENVRHELAIKGLRPDDMLRMKDLLHRGLTDQDEAVRLAVIRGLAHFKHDQDVVGWLDNARRKDKAQQVRLRAAHTIGREPPKSHRRALFVTMAALGIVVAGMIALRAIMPTVDRLPAPVSSAENGGLLGVNDSVRSVLYAMLDGIAQDSKPVDGLVLHPQGVHRLRCPRQLSDILSGTAPCDVLVFRADFAGTDFPARFLVTRSGGKVRTIAIEVSDWSDNSPDGVFVELPQTVAPEYQELNETLRNRVTEIAADLNKANPVNHPLYRKTILASMAANAGNKDRIENILETNEIVQHLRSLEPLQMMDLSLGVGIYMIRDTGPLGVFSPAFHTILKPLFVDRKLDETLAHELTHATLHQLGPDDRSELLVDVAPYFADAHPDLLTSTLPLFYEDEIDDSDPTLAYAEETLAFLTGSLAAHKSSIDFIVVSRPVMEARDILVMTEPILSNDVELVCSIGLAPAWMSPKALGYSKEKIDEDYYELVDTHLEQQRP